MDNETLDYSELPLSKDERKLAEEAALHYYAANYDHCYEATRKLSDLRPNDPKVLMNTALIEYVKNTAYRRTEDYISKLQYIATGEGLSLSDSSAILGAEANSSLLPGPTAILPPSDLAVTLQYNYALTLFFQKLYLQCEGILSTLINIRPSLRSDTGELKGFTNKMSRTIALDLTPSTDVTLCQRIILLWLEVLLCLQKPERVFELCDVWLVLLSSLSVVTMLTTVEPPATTSGTAPTFRGLSTQAAYVLTGIRRPIQCFYVRACLLIGRLSDGKQELEYITSNSSRKAPAVSQEMSSVVDQGGQEALTTPQEVAGDKQPPEVSGRKAQGSYQLVAPDYERNVFCSMPFFQAHLAYLLGDYSGALKHLSNIPLPSRPPVETGQCLWTLLRNNLGVVHHRLGKFNISGLHLRLALRVINRTLVETVSSRPELSTSGESGRENKSTGVDAITREEAVSEIPVQAFSLAQHHMLFYNIGLQLLFSRRPTAAFPVLLELVNVYPQNPRLWYRLAECCIKVHCPDNLSDWRLQAKERCGLKSVGTGACRKLVLTCRPPASKRPDEEVGSVPQPSLEFAFLCLRNAATLLPRPPPHTNVRDGCQTATEKTMKSPLSAKLLLNWAGLQSVPVAPSPGVLRGPGLLHLLSAVHLASAYVALCLDHPVETVRQSACLLPSDTFTSPSTLTEEVVQTGGDLDETVAVRQRPASDHCHGCCASICPPAYRFLIRLYLAEALCQLDQLEDAVGLLSGCLPVDCSAVQVSLSDLAQKSVGSVDLSPKNLLPIVSSDVGTVDTSDGVQDVSVDLPGRACIWSVDFPSTATQSCALLLYNLAALLAMEPQWHSSAHSYLALALPGLQLTPEALNNRRYGDQDSTITLLPVSAVLLQIYLRYFRYSTESGDDLIVSDGSGLTDLLYEHFGSLALASRIYSPSAGSPSTGSHSFGLSLGDLRKLVKAQLASLMPNSLAQPSQHYAQQQQQQQQKQQVTSQQTSAGGGVQFPNNFWIMNLQQQQQQQRQQLQQQQQHRYMNQWDSPGLIPEPLAHGSSNTNLVTTGIITSTNESDWPPL